jgi:S-adenosylmethionine hydrolase
VTTITFLSDYGTADEFVGVVRSVLARLAPGVAVVDLCHEVPAHDVRAGARLLVRALPYLAPGVVLAVVDPSVGTRRRAVALETGGSPPRALVGPDNGLLAAPAEAAGGVRRAVALDRREVARRAAALGSPSSRVPAHGPTFDGRDLFAPAAALLALGLDLGELGPPLEPASLMPTPRPHCRVRRGEVEVEVVGVDRFGNLELGAGPEEAAAAGLPAPGGALLVVPTNPTKGTAVPARRVVAFGELDEGEVGLLVDSAGSLALVVDRASAAARLGLGRGDRVRLASHGDERQAVAGGRSGGRRRALGKAAV